MGGIFRLFFIGAGVLCVCAQGLYAQVEVSTDKPEYALKEAIAISVVNAYPYPVFSIANTSTSAYAIANFERRRNQWGWDAYAIRCHRLNCDQGKSEEPKEIAPGRKITFTWVPEIYEQQSKRAPKPGVYGLRLSIRRKNGREKTTGYGEQPNQMSLRCGSKFETKKGGTE